VNTAPGLYSIFGEYVSFFGHNCIEEIKNKHVKCNFNIHFVQIINYIFKENNYHNIKMITKILLLRHNRGKKMLKSSSLSAIPNDEVPCNETSLQTLPGSSDRTIVQTKVQKITPRK
jgi:hypothetical protein